MKTNHLCISVLFMLCVNVTAQPIIDPLFVITNQFEGKAWACRIDEQQLQSSPKWDPNRAEVPPLAPGKAMSLAERYVGDLVQTPQSGGRWLGSFVITANLSRAMVITDCWYYNVTVHVGRGGFSTNTLSVIVMMDGKIPAFAEIPAKTATGGKPGKL
jgi:hypothetical protein